LKSYRPSAESQVLAVALDGTKIHANASRHSALSHEHAGRIEAQLKAEVADLLAQAEAVDRVDIPDGLSIRMNWRGARSVWPSSPRLAPRSRHGLGNVSTIPAWTSVSPVRRPRRKTRRRSRPWSTA
jgi:hypothetical protein